MLQELEALHEATRAALHEMEALTLAAFPDRATLASLRWKLTSFSMRRLKLVELEIYPALLVIASPQESAQLDELASERRERRQMSADHIASWSLERAVSDWDEYRKASMAIRSSTVTMLNREREVLVPLLQRLECASCSQAAKPRHA